MKEDRALQSEHEIDEILFDCLERPEEEWEDAIAEACRDRKDLATRITRRFELLRSFGMTHHDPSKPATIGSYDLLRPIGGGTMGTVFLARRRGESGDVALKMLQAGLRFSSAARRRFARESVGSGAWSPSRSSSTRRSRPSTGSATRTARRRAAGAASSRA